MRIAYFDTVGGIAGDMTMAAFVSAGMPIDTLIRELRKLPIGDFDLIPSHVSRSSVAALHIDVIAGLEEHPHRHLRDILDLVDKSNLSARVKERSNAIFRVIAEAEACIHNTTPEKVHFHEVGALDSILDIVGTAICLDHFHIEQTYSSPVRLGSGGMIQTQHGRMPTPSPATLEILKGYPTVLTAVPHELTTPTGAAIIKALSGGVLDEEVIRVSAIGYGAGSTEFPEIPNFLRLIIGDLQQPLDRDDVVVVETNIDDMNPQVYPFLIEQLLTAGAHDAYLVPIIMKKGRPGILLSVLLPAPKLQEITDILYRQTSTIGLRIQHSGRRKLKRRLTQVQTSFGPVNVKITIRDGKEMTTPEFDECKRIATEKHMSLLEVRRILDRELTPGRRSASPSDPLIER